MENRFCSRCGNALTGQVACPNCGVYSGVCNTGRHVPDYLVWSIISVIFGGVLGIIAIVFSMLCRSDVDAGRYESALRNSNVAFWCNVICLVLVVIGFFAGIMVLVMCTLMAW